MILVCDKAIEKTKHRVILPDMSRIAGWITNHYIVFVIAFLVVLVPAIYGYTHTDVYYDLTGTLPETFSSKVGNDKLTDQYHMGATHMVLAKSDLSEKDSMNMIDDIKKVDGVKLAASLDSVMGPNIPQEMAEPELSAQQDLQESVSHTAETEAVHSGNTAPIHTGNTTPITVDEEIQKAMEPEQAASELSSENTMELYDVEDLEKYLSES